MYVSLRFPLYLLPLAIHTHPHSFTLQTPADRERCAYTRNNAPRASCMSRNSSREANKHSSQCICTCILMGN